MAVLCSIRVGWGRSRRAPGSDLGQAPGTDGIGRSISGGASSKEWNGPCTAASRPRSTSLDFQQRQRCFEPNRPSGAACSSSTVRPARASPQPRARLAPQRKMVADEPSSRGYELLFVAEDGAGPRCGERRLAGASHSGGGVLPAAGSREAPLAGGGLRRGAAASRLLRRRHRCVPGVPGEGRSVAEYCTEKGRHVATPGCEEETPPPGRGRGLGVLVRAWWPSGARPCCWTWAGAACRPPPCEGARSSCPAATSAGSPERGPPGRGSARYAAGRVRPPWRVRVGRGRAGGRSNSCCTE
ncbi:unnamed protein product [Prorocentrum cordatum]|uniref:Uncharacterized protein n=1 Tax=Prorocentrum cordatum TaxID=2364126 RepID=A0ABN9UN69_9DINO|nr:unnamed protein product [Polarella glacialis]